ncbi:MAG: hypothetical protein H6828_14310 [Planctomycetes bacterium]|nr:hypothetical protein [Planctomycetota bacterium]
MVAAWEARLAALRQAEGAAAEAAARAERERIARSYPLLESLADRVHALAQARTGADGLPARAEAARQELDASRATMRELTRRYLSAQDRVRAGGLTEAMGLILRRDYEWLPSERDLRRDTLEAQAQSSAAQLEAIEYSEEREDAGDPTTLQALEQKLPSDAAQRDELVEVLGEQVHAQAAALDDVLHDLQGLTAALDELVDARVRLERLAGEYRSYIEQRILWVRSTEPDPLPSLLAAPTRALELAEHLAGAPWGELASAAREHRAELGLSGLLLVALVVGRRHLKRKLAELGGLVRSYKTDRYLHTVRALVITLLLAAPGPLLAFTAGWLAGASEDKLVGSIGLGLRETARVWLALNFVRRLLVDKGVGSAHFRWPVNSLSAARRELRWLAPIVVALLFVVLALDRYGKATWSDSLGRPAFVLVMSAVSLASWRLLHSEAAFWSGLMRSGEGFVSRTHRLWSAVAILLPAALAVAALAGYLYTALQFGERLRDSIGLTLLLLLAYGLLVRWLYLERRKLAVAQALEARERRAAEAEAQAQAGTATTSGEQPVTPFDADRIDIPALDARTRELFRSGITVAMVLGLWFLWASVLPALQGLDRVQLWPELTLLDARDVQGTAVAPAGARRPARRARRRRARRTPRPRARRPARRARAPTRRPRAARRR